MANDSVGWMWDLIPSPDGQHVAVSWNRPVRDTRRPDRPARLLTYVLSLRDAASPGGTAEYKAKRVVGR